MGVVFIAVSDDINSLPCSTTIEGSQSNVKINVSKPRIHILSNMYAVTSCMVTVTRAILYL